MEKIGVEFFTHQMRDAIYFYKIINTRKQKFYTGNYHLKNRWSIRGKVYTTIPQLRQGVRNLLAHPDPDDPYFDPTFLGIQVFQTKPHAYIPMDIFQKHPDKTIAINLIRDKESMSIK